MKKHKPVLVAALIWAVLLSIITIGVSHFDWPFLPYLFLAGSFLAFVQKETVSYKFIDKLIVGSLVLGFLFTFLVFFKLYAFSNLVHHNPLPLKELWDHDTIVLAFAYSVVSFLGGLLGIVLKGLYSLYKEKLNWIIIIIGPVLTSLASLAVFKTKIGGTVMSGYYGLPYSYFTYQIKDVVDGFSIDKWSFSPGSFYHYIIFNYLLYFAIFVGAFYLLKFINKKLKTKKINITFSLFGLLVLLSISFTSFLPAKMSYIEHQISKAKYCETTPDCTIIDNKPPFSCAIAVNTENHERILNLLNSFPSTGELQCLGDRKTACLQNRCEVTIDQTPNATYWEMIKTSIENCQVDSIMQAHDLTVIAYLKNGEILKASEPEIDDVFDIIDQSDCQDITMITE